MSLIETIRAQKTDARKDVNRSIEVAFLNLLLGEIETVEKRTGKLYNDSQVIDAIKKLIKSNDESLKHRFSEKLVVENAILTALLPKQLSEAEIRELISSNALVGVPAVMMYLNSNYAGQFDKGLVSTIARS